MAVRVARATILVEDGLRKTFIFDGLVDKNIYDVDCDAHALPEPELLTSWIGGRTFEIYRHDAGPYFGADGLKRSPSLVPLKYRNADLPSKSLEEK